MKRIIFIFLLLLGSYGSFAQINPSTSQANSISTSTTLEVSINKKGKILVDGKKVSVEDLDKLIKELKSKKGVLKFAKTNSKNKKAKKANTEFLKLIRKHRVTLKLYTNDTFTKELNY